MVIFSAQKNTHYLLIFDAAVILMCLTSSVLCIRSIFLAIRLLQVIPCPWKITVYEYLLQTCPIFDVSSLYQFNQLTIFVHLVYPCISCASVDFLRCFMLYLYFLFLQRFSKFCVWKYNRKVCEEDQREFLNGWYILVIISDVMAIIGSILKMQIQAKVIMKY